MIEKELDKWAQKIFDHNKKYIIVLGIWIGLWGLLIDHDKKIRKIQKTKAIESKEVSK
jgi:hypothetical protein